MKRSVFLLSPLASVALTAFGLAVHGCSDDAPGTNTSGSSGPGATSTSTSSGAGGGSSTGATTGSGTTSSSTTTNTTGTTGSGVTGAGGATGSAGSGGSGVGSTSTTAGTAGSSGVGSGGGGSATTGSNTGGSTGTAGAGGTMGTGGSGGKAGNDGGTAGSGGKGGGTTGDAGTGKFSFFATSLVAMRRLSKSQNGFGGDLRYGEMDGLTGADKICTEIAEASMPGSGAKQWRAFLSVSKGTAGTPVNAASRIGQGPWYDRLGRQVASNLTNLLATRPSDADPIIKEDLPNEFGVPNHYPDGPMPVPPDNHHFLTGSDSDGKLYAGKSTCLDWTSKARDNVATGRPRIGFSWSISNRTDWISGQDEGGCGDGVAIEPNGGSDPKNPIVGSGGGYGGIYCFALMP